MRPLVSWPRRECSKVNEVGLGSSAKDDPFQFGYGSPSIGGHPQRAIRVGQVNKAMRVPMSGIARNKTACRLPNNPKKNW